MHGMSFLEIGNCQNPTVYHHCVNIAIHRIPPIFRDSLGCFWKMGFPFTILFGMTLRSPLFHKSFRFDNKTKLVLRYYHTICIFMCIYSIHVYVYIYNWLHTYNHIIYKQSILWISMFLFNTYISIIFHMQNLLHFRVPILPSKNPTVLCVCRSSPKVSS